MTKKCPQCEQYFGKRTNESLKDWQNRHVYCSKSCYVESMKGRLPISIQQWNVRGVAWNRGKALLHLRGKNSASWKGGKGSERHAAMGKVEYKQWRQEVFERDDYTCQVCYQRGGYIHADHIKGWSEYPELRFDLANGRTLCRTCHYYVTFKRKMPANSRWGLPKASAQEA